MHPSLPAAKDVFAFSPDTVHRGSGTLEILRKQIGETGRILMKWEPADAPDPKGVQYREMR